jgi:molybdopterin molybdotransferase
MLSVEEALEKILGCVSVLPGEGRSVLEALGHVLAEDVVSDIAVPPQDNSAMDGYALRVEDIAGAGPACPRTLRVLGTVAAGESGGYTVGPGEAVRIMTGAPVPSGASGVVPFEDTDETTRTDRSNIGIRTTIAAGDNIRLAGEDISRGSLIMEKGSLIGPAEVGVLASLGRRTVKVIRRPVVAILATGDELLEAGEPLVPGKRYNSNSYSLAALVRYYGGIPRILGIARDSEDSVVAGLRRGLAADMLITSGGVSRGDYDVVKDVLAKQGEIGFWTVRMKPGKPLAFGLIRGADEDGAVRMKPHLGLPGNPVSVMTTFELFGRPAIFKMMGKKDFGLRTVEAVMVDSLKNTDGRRIYARVRLEERGGEYLARLTGLQGSGILTSMSRANGLAIIPEDWAEAKPGDKVAVVIPAWQDVASRETLGGVPLDS